MSGLHGIDIPICGRGLPLARHRDLDCLRITHGSQVISEGTEPRYVRCVRGETTGGDTGQGGHRTLSSRALRGDALGGSYAKVDPAFIGIPFFYWYQMLWVLISTALTVIAYQLWQRDQRAAPRRRAVRRSEGRRERRRTRRLHLLLPGRHGHGLPGGTLAQGRERAEPRRMGPGRTVVRHLGHLVPARRRPLHGVHLRRRSRGDLRGGRGRLLRGAVHDPRLPADLHVPAPAVVGLAQARLCDDLGLRARPLRLEGPVAGGGRHRHPGHDAVHRAPTRRHPGRAGRDGRRRRREHQLVRQGPAAAHRLRCAGGVHLLLGSARPRADRVREGQR